MTSDIFGAFEIGLAVWMFTWGINRVWLSFKSFMS